MTKHFEMAYQDSAGGLTMLFIHGFPFSSSMWEMQLDDLHELVRVIAPDLRGHGFSEVEPPYSIAQYADDCITLLNSLGIIDPVVICGLSMGGYVALDLVQRYPERIAALILTATRAAPDDKTGKANRDKAIASVQANGVEALVKALLPKLFSPSTLESAPELADIMQSMMVATPTDGVIGALKAMRDRADARLWLSSIAVPTMIIHGADDQIVPIDEAQYMAEAIPDAEFVRLVDAGHLPPIEQPEEFNKAVARFLITTFGDEEE
ncbi:MAG: alpha/beta fold hydrolase [Anaerolineae bacterium]|nr:alpha/beta fold hydrolase [Anaerolineae bacterium]